MEYVVEHSGWGGSVAVFLIYLSNVFVTRQSSR